ncbi:MAG: MBL fold metallo-hydrolase, partial [Acidobacteria bacterium]|nr:MBL fold metallo-hydrolase [Acidobacteriota bacterium]MCA1612340.1 MBL fold metallo-hydrolase [Acidobacteriota bacterium]
RAAVYFLGPGHTNGDLIVLLPEEKILFSGDLVVNGRLPYLQSADSDPHGWEQILTRLATLDVEKIVPGHGKVGTRQSVGDSLAYLRKINELSKLFIETRVPDELYEMKLREPDNRITNVIVGPDHIANVRAAVKLERARLEKASAAPTPGAKPGPKATPARPAKKS